VVKAHAVVRFQGTDAGASPSVSIVVQRRAGGAFPVAEVSQLVARAVPGIRSEDVVVSVVDELQQPSSGQTKSAAVEGSMVPFLLYWRVAASDYNGLALITIGLLLSVSLMAGLAGYIFGQYNLTRHAEPRHFEPLDSGPRMEQLSAPKDQENDGGRYE
jgi:type III secretory pathway lipoprotein EscJ